MSTCAHAMLVLVDLGGTQIRVSVSNEEGDFSFRSSRLTLAERGGDAILETLIEAIREAVTQSSRPVCAISVAAPGPLDPRKGVIVRAPNLAGWENVPLVDILTREFDVPVLLGNDANLAALGEQRFGAAKGHRDVVYLTVSTGIGGGVIIDNRLLVGSHGYGAELGHTSIMADGPRCKCGSYGCLEALAAGPAIARHAKEALAEGARSAMIALCGGQTELITAKIVTDAARQGDELAQEVLRRAGFYLGVGIVNFMYTFDPTVVVIGGGVSNAGPLLFDPVIATIQERAPEPYREHCRIVKASLGDNVGLMGALAHYLAQKEG